MNKVALKNQPMMTLLLVGIGMMFAVAVIFLLVATMVDEPHPLPLCSKGQDSKYCRYQP